LYCSLKAKDRTKNQTFKAKARTKDSRLKAKDRTKDWRFKAKARTKDCNFVLKDNPRPRTKAKDNIPGFSKLNSKHTVTVSRG